LALSEVVDFSTSIGRRSTALYLAVSRTLPPPTRQPADSPAPRQCRRARTAPLQGVQIGHTREHARRHHPAVISGSFLLPTWRTWGQVLLDAAEGASLVFDPHPD